MISQGPYYEQNFTLVLETVHSAEYNSHLFTADERALAQSILSLPKASLRLLIRISQRSGVWFRIARLDYPEIAAGCFDSCAPCHFADLTEPIDCLLLSGILWSESKLEKLSAVLELLPAPDVRILAKEFRVSLSGSSTKEETVEALLKHIATQVPMSCKDGINNRNLSSDHLNKLFFVVLSKCWEGVSSSSDCDSIIRCVAISESVSDMLRRTGL